MCLARGDFLNASFQHNPGHIPGLPLGTPEQLPYPTDQARATSSHDGGGSDRVGGSEVAGGPSRSTPTSRRPTRCPSLGPPPSEIDFGTPGTVGLLGSPGEL